MKERDYPLLKNAPPHDSDEFIDYLRENNVVIDENGTYIMIENVKYHTTEKPWYTIFFKCKHFPHCSCSSNALSWLDDDYDEWEWLKKSADKQTVKRFHIHIYKS